MNANPSSISARARAAKQALPGAARLEVVVPVAVVSFFYAAVLEYVLPLYFSAQHEGSGGHAFPADVWSQMVKYQITPWIVGPIVAGLLARRYGERIIWSASLVGQTLIPLALTLAPSAWLIPFIGLWQGITGALLWTAGISLVQMVAPHKRGLANGLVMAALGLGSIFGPLAGRLFIYRREWSQLIREPAPHLAARLFGFVPLTSAPQFADFRPLFALLAASTVLCGILVLLWGQHSGRFDHETVPDWRCTLSEVGQLARLPQFWVLAVNVCLLGGLPLQASNQFLPYRAEDLGLKHGAQDAGWILLQLLRVLMWLPGGIAIGYFAGKRAAGPVAVVTLAVTALTAFGIGVSSAAWQLFTTVAVFEFVRQFVRWLETGYLSELMPSHLRATAIGFSLAVAGLGSTVFGWLAAYWWNPTTQSASPFLISATLSGASAVLLFLIDRRMPIRDPAGLGPGLYADSVQTANTPSTGTPALGEQPP